jgi:hypothetical protein
VAFTPGTIIQVAFAMVATTGYMLAFLLCWPMECDADNTFAVFW